VRAASTTLHHVGVHPWKLRIDPSARTPLSAQLRDRLAAQIARGRLVPGERLLPVREAAARLGLAPNTVAKAYRELEAMGLLVGRGRRGTFVSDRLPERPSDADAVLAAAAEAFVRRARQLGAGDDEARRAVARALRARAGPGRG
jgi:DNA-binding transcriptional regulator YhcF (GntR family)